MSDHNTSDIPGSRNLAGPLSQLPESVRPQVAGWNPGPVLYPVRTDLFQSRGKLHQRFASMSWHVSAGGGIALHGDSTAGKEEVDFTHTEHSLR